MPTLSILALYELGNNLHKPFPLLPMRRVARIGESEPPHPWYLLEVRLDYYICGFIMSSIQEHGWHLNLRHTVLDTPVFQRSYDVEL
jgi:hypothetical protein